MDISLELISLSNECNARGDRFGVDICWEAIREIERLQVWTAEHFDENDLAESPGGWKVDNCRLGWIDAPDWLVKAIHERQDSTTEDTESKEEK